AGIAPPPRPSSPWQEPQAMARRAPASSAWAVAPSTARLVPAITISRKNAAFADTWVFLLPVRQRLPMGADGVQICISGPHRPFKLASFLRDDQYMPAIAEGRSADHGRAEAHFLRRQPMAFTLNINGADMEVEAAP